jgi:hypothetical protein
LLNLPGTFQTRKVPGLFLGNIPPVMIDRLAIALLTLLIVAAAPARAVAQLKKVETQDVRLVYISPSEDYLVPHAARTFLRSDAFLKELFKFNPKEKTTLLLADISDQGNAGATSVPYNSVRVQIAPLSFTFETITAGERMNNIMSHELVHVIAMDQAAGRDKVFRKLFFGKVIPVAEQPESILFFYLTLPRVSAPRWYHEGVAVFIDTWENSGIGRAQGGYDEMVFRSMVKDGSRFYDPLGLAAEGTKNDFQMGVNSYLYGGRFVTWLAYRYSPEKVIEWVSRQKGSRAYYANQFKHVFGTPLETAWAEWVAFEHKFQEANLAEIRKFPLTQPRDISPRALGSVSRAYYDERTKKIYAAFNYPGTVAHVGAISTETGNLSHLRDVRGPLIYQVTSLAYDAAGPTLFYTDDNLGHRELMQLDLGTGQVKVLQKNARIGDLVVNRADRSLWGIRQLNGLSTIVRMAPPYTDWKRAVTFDYGTIVYDMDISPDGKTVSASFGEISGKQSVRLMSVEKLLKGDFTPDAEFDLEGTVVNGFTFSPDGKYLYGSSYLSGVSNIFRYEIATKEVEAVSNAETGLFRPIPLGGDELLAFRYSGDGFVPTRLTAQVVKDVGAITFLGERTIDKHPVLKSWALGSPADIPYDTMQKTTGTYNLAGGLHLESIYPIAQGYKKTASVGLRANFSDPLQFNRAYFTVGWSPGGDLPTSERLHVSADYARYNWTAHASWNNADSYDLYGSTKRSRKGYAVSLKKLSNLIYETPRTLKLEVEGRVAGRLDQLPEYQNVAVKVDQLYSLNANVLYSNVRSSLGHIDDEKGVLWSIAARNDYVNDTFFTRAHATFDVGAALPIGHSSIWLRSAAGLSPQDASEPFANFYFGAFGNNYIDRNAEKRYREYYALPGAKRNSIAGRNFVRSMVEWNLPPVRFSRVGTKGAYVSWVRPALFVSGLMTNLDEKAIQRKALSTGAQLDFKITVMAVLDMTLSVGGGVTFERDRKAAREGMISLRVLK